MAGDDLELNLDPSGYLVGVQQVDQANQRLQRSFGSVTTGSTGVQRAIGLITPGRAAIASMTLFAQQAAQSQEGLSGLQATAAVTGVRVDRLSGSIRQMARDMPVGYQTSRAVVEQITKMGIASEGSEKRIGALATTAIKLSGATGEGVGQLTQGMVELSRATGNNNLDPKRFENLADSLTTTAAKAGASATSVLQFSKVIAPMAQASGIGATGILGISTAFAKLGEDGIGASTAVTKMLSDMNKSVREGSPEMKSYAAIVGKSADEFERLFKANPAEALTQVTEAISKAGPQGPRILEQLGIEGVRGQRSIQALVASGGLRESISTAVGAYGNGNTTKASDAAFGGLNDSLGKAAESARQVAEAMGQPLLSPLTKFTDVVKTITDKVGGVIGSGPVQGGLSAMAYGGVGLLAARSLMGPLGMIGLGRQAVTSGPARAVAAAITNRTGSTGRLFRYGMPAQGGLEEGNMGPRTSALYNRVWGFTDQWQKLNPPTGDPSIFQRLRTGASAYGGNILNTYMKSVAQQYTNARVDPYVQARESRSWRTPWRQGALRFNDDGSPMMARRDALIPSEGFSRAWQAAQKVDTTGMSQWKVLTTGMSAFNKELTSATGSTLGLRQQLGALGSVAGQTARFGGRLGLDAARGVMGGVSAVGRFLGPGMAIGAGIAGATYLYQQNQQRRDENAQVGQGDIRGSLNDYRESIGKATDATKTFTQLNENFATQLAKNSQALGFDATRTVTDADVKAAKDKPDVVHSYVGDQSQIAAQIASVSPNGLAPDELQAIKVDLLRQFDKGSTSSILQQLPAGMDASTNDQTGSAYDIPQIQSSVKGITGSDRNGWRNMMSGGNGNWSILEGSDPTGPGQFLYGNPLSDKAMDRVQGVAEGISQKADSQSTKFGTKYGLQEQIKGMNAALKTAYDQGDVSTFYELSKRFGVQLGGNKTNSGDDMGNVVWSGNTFAANGFDISKDVATQSDTFKGQLADLLGAGGKVNGQGGVSQEMQPGIWADTIAPQSKYLASLFDNRSSTSASRAMAASIATPLSTSLQDAAVNEAINGAHQAGKSMSDLAIEANRASGAVGDNADQYQRLKEIQHRAEQQMAYENQDLTPGQQQMKMYQHYTAVAAIVPQNDAQKAEVEDAKTQKQQYEAAIRDRLTARLQVERQTEIAITRAHEDADRQQLYADQDYQTQKDRLERNAGIARAQTEHNYNQQVARTNADFKNSQLRTERDFHIQVAQMNEDFNINRAHQVRDFNKQLKRQIEDSASTMYDPYSRIQTKATWDSKNLLVNMQEQTDAIAKQKSQLDQLRKMGLSMQAIDQLGLGKAENAQQVSNLVADGASDPASIAALSVEAKRRAAAASSLYTDSSNKDLRQSREDQVQSFKDQDEELAKTLKRQRAQLDRSLGDGTFDLKRNLDRAAADNKYALGQMDLQLKNTLADMSSDRDRATARAEDQLNRSLTRMGEDVKNADKTISGSMSTLAEQLNRALHGKAVKWQSILKDDTLSWVADVQKTVVPLVGGVFAQFGVSTSTSGAGSSAAADRNINGSGTAGSSSAADRAYGGGYSTSISEGGGYSGGGEIQGYSPNEKSDNIPARLTAGEFVQNVHAVRHYGTDTMHAINNRSVPKERLVQAVRGFASGGWIDPVSPVKPEFPWGHYPSGGIHRALDYAVPIGTPVHAPYSGTIIKSGWSTTGFGNEIEMLNNTGTYSILGHNSRLVAKLGDSVQQGQVVSFSGASGHVTGPHVHLEMRTRALDPNSAYDFTNGSSGLAGAFGSIASLVTGVAKVATAQATVNDLFSHMQNKPGIYNSLTASAKKQLTAQLYDQGGVIPHGGVGVNLSGKPERVLTDSQWATLSTLAARGGGVSLEDVRGLHSGAGVHIVINNTGAVTYDSRNDFSGAQITVQSQDPDDMGRKLQAKQTRQRLTQTRGVRR